MTIKPPSKAPETQGIPWLVPDPLRTMAEWRNRANGLISFYEGSIATLKEQIKSPALRSSTRERLKKTRELEIRHIEFLRDVLSPLKLNSKLSADQVAGFGYKIPVNQGLQSYFANLVRDWGADNGENQVQLRALEHCLDSASLGRLLVIGAGACRLAFDLHQTGRTSETICADINPILLFAAKRIIGGETLKVVEFPVAPKSLDAIGAIRECKRPSSPRDGLTFMFADAYHLPFEDGSLDSILTPWLIDILPHRLEALASEINRVLKPGGRWINTGSFNIQLRDVTHRYTPEEAREILKENGFDVEALRQDEIPYLHSDLSCHARTETITTFRATKASDIKMPIKIDLVPAWLKDPSAPVPVLPAFQSAFVTLEPQAIVLSLIDGQKSVTEIAGFIAQRYGLPPDDALDAVATFLTKQIEGTTFL